MGCWDSQDGNNPGRIRPPNSKAPPCSCIFGDCVNGARGMMGTWRQIPRSCVLGMAPVVVKAATEPHCCPQFGKSYHLNPTTLRATLSLGCQKLARRFQKVVRRCPRQSRDANKLSRRRPKEFQWCQKGLLAVPQDGPPVPKGFPDAPKGVRWCQKVGRRCKNVPLRDFKGHSGGAELSCVPEVPTIAAGVQQGVALVPTVFRRCPKVCWSCQQVLRARRKAAQRRQKASRDWQKVFPQCRMGKHWQKLLWG